MFVTEVAIHVMNKIHNQKRPRNVNEEIEQTCE